MSQAYVIKKPKGVPLEKSLCFHPNYGWLMPALEGWNKVYFYQSNKTAETALKSRSYLWPDAEVVPVNIQVSE